MLDFVDILLLKRVGPADDRTLTVRRIDGNSESKVIYFLPWHTPVMLAQCVGLMPLDFLACYEMPPAIVSSQPSLCLQAMLGLVKDAERLLLTRGAKGRDVLIVGLSAGTYPATYLANRLGARLFSVASADRADLAFWESPATRLIKQRAMRQGFGLKDYSEALRGSHPAENLKGIAPNSVFVIGRRDPFIPACRQQRLSQAIETHADRAQIVEVDAGHFKTLVMSGSHQRAAARVDARPTGPGWSRGLLRAAGLAIQPQVNERLPAGQIPDPSAQLPARRRGPQVERGQPATKVRPLDA